MPEKLGRMLRRVRCDERRSQLAAFDAPAPIALRSPAFADGAAIPAEHAGRGVGENISPELEWTGIPADPKQLLLVLEDVDVPLPRPLLHTVVVIEPRVDHLAVGALHQGTPGLRFIRTALGSGYAGPRPIPGHGVHRYRFHLFALDIRVPDTVTSARALFTAIRGHVIARGLLTGTYQR